MARFMVKNRCGQQMAERKRDQAGSDGISWYCQSCKTTKSIPYNSFFTKSRLSLQQWMILIVWWEKEYPVLKAAKEADTSDNTACQVYQWLREVCSTRLLQTQIVLGGPGIIVQVDESQFRHKPKVKYQKNNNSSLSKHSFI